MSKRVIVVGIVELELVELGSDQSERLAIKDVC